MAGADIDVKDILLLGSYKGAFSSVMSSIDGQFNSASMFLDGLVDQYIRQITNSIHTIVSNRQQGIHKAEVDLVKAAAQTPPSPSEIANAVKRMEHCKEAFEMAKKTEKQSEELVKQLRIKVIQARDQVRHYQVDMRNKNSEAVHYLGAYIDALNKYKEQNGS